MHRILEYLPFLWLHFALLLLGWYWLRKQMLLRFPTALGPAWDIRFQIYQMLLLVMMVLFCFVLTMTLLLNDRIVLSLCNDFVFLAGVLLTPRRAGWVWMTALLCTIAREWLAVGDLFWCFYMSLDVTIYCASGMLVKSMLEVRIGAYTWQDLIFIAGYKLLASLGSAALWLLLGQDTLISGIDLLLFRIAGWPLVSLPAIILFLLMMNGDYQLHEGRRQY